MEKIQMVGFFIQEVILSVVYIKKTIRLLKLSQSVPGEVQSFDDGSAPSQLKSVSMRTTMYQLLAINVLIILLDLGLLGIELANLYLLQTTLKGAVYSIKLKLEFAVLGKMVQIVRTRNDSSSSGKTGPTISQFERRTNIAAGRLTLERTNSAGTRLGTGSLSHDFGDQGLPDFVDPRQVSPNVTHAEPREHVEYGWENRMREGRERWRRRSRVRRGTWIDEEMDKHNIK